jgi:hypothetical protein
MRNILTSVITIFCFLNQLMSQTETFGTGVNETPIANYSGYTNKQVIYTGTGDIRTTNSSSGYTSASGGANVFLTGNSSNSSFTISSIEISNNSAGGTLCFGVRKNTTASNGSELSISYSGATGSSSITLPTGTGTTSWQYVCLNIIFNSNEISITFTNNSTENLQFRLDDISLSNSILPIKLQAFHVTKINKTTKINWTTSHEKSSSHFLIQRSQDGSNFETIGQVNSVGDSEITNNYSYIDNQPKKGNNYYRLVQVDLDGTKNPHKTEMIHMPYEQGFTLINTIVDQENTSLQLSSDVEKYHVSIYDISGQKVLQIENLNFDQLIDTKDLAQGIYVAHCEGNGEVSTFRFVKK